MAHRALIGPGGVGMSGTVVVVQRDEQRRNGGARVRSVKMRGDAGRWAEGYGRQVTWARRRRTPCSGSPSLGATAKTVERAVPLTSASQPQRVGRKGVGGGHQEGGRHTEPGLTYSNRPPK